MRENNSLRSLELDIGISRMSRLVPWRKEEEAQRRKGKVFLEAFTRFWLFFRFSELDVGISRIVSPSSWSRKEDEKQRRKRKEYFFGFTRFWLFFRFSELDIGIRESSRLVLDEEKKMRSKNAKESFFFWFYEALTFFFRFSELDVGISRIISPSSPWRKEDEDQRRERKEKCGKVRQRAL